MPYTQHFKHADDVVAHLNSMVPMLPDPLLQAKYVGFVSVVAVTVYELAIKDVFITFSARKHKVFGSFAGARFNRINGRIKLSEIRSNYLPSFGEKYLLRFERNLDKLSKQYLIANRRHISSSYGSVISCRHNFAHQGAIQTNVTYSEIVQAYEDGKEIIHCLAKTMNR